MPTYQTVPQDEYGSYAWLRREVGAYLGAGFNPDAWDTETASKIDSIVQSGLQQFYFPPPIPDKEGKATPYRWSFLSPVAELKLEIGTSIYALPTDFAGIVEEVTVGQ
jgi:hypothetical protein